ncbi:response regulator transcription factor [Aeromicrobium sp.]|nr:response regulator transcription factor [Candidatus Saccharibacteria bacterium]
MNILIIEPDTVLAKLYTKALQRAGDEVVCCVNAQSAVFSADERQPDAVVLELQLVKHSGIEFLYEFRSYPEWQAIPVIVLSNVPPVEFIDNWKLLQRQLGVVDYLYKPHTTLAKLLKTVDNVRTTAVQLSP